MSHVKVPVLLSQYSDDLFTARVIDGPEVDASGITATETLQWVRRALRKQGSQQPDQYWPGIDRYELHHTAVRVRLFYRDGKRQFPASREMKVPVRYVLGHYVDESVECFLPDYDLVFHCPAMGELSQLIDEAVRGSAANVHSRQLAAAIPPLSSELRIVRIRLQNKRSDHDWNPTETLATVADPVVSRQRRIRHTPLKHRDAEVARLLATMCDASVLLVGPPGVGKTTVAQLAATQFENDAKNSLNLHGRRSAVPRVWHSSAENLIAGMQYLGQWEHRLEIILAELESIDGVLLIQSLVDLVRLGGTTAADSLAAFMMPYVRRGEVRLIVETTAQELDVTRRLLPGWAECFQIIPVDPLTAGQTRDIAATMLAEAAKNHRLIVAESVAETATRLFTQFLPYQVPPRGVVQLIGDAITATRAASSKTASSKSASGREHDSDDCPSEARDADCANVLPGQLTTRQIIARFTNLTGLPAALLRDSIPLHAATLRTHFANRVIGQPMAVETICNLVLRLKAGLCDPQRPLATMMFCGPTGVGKTQLSNTLAEYLFGESKNSAPPLIRLDMSEYSSWDAVERFLIAGDGQVASWIGQLRRRPMSVLLLDEFEKASPQVHDCLLSALDEGRLSDRFGRCTTLCGAIIILTSNVGSQSTTSIGFGANDPTAIRRAIEQEFRPEFLNRLDDVVCFEPLSQQVIRQIVEKELRALAAHEALRSRRVRLHWDDAVIDRLAAIGFDPLWGARPLQRAIQRQVVARLARQLLSAAGDPDPCTIDLRRWVTDRAVADHDRCGGGGPTATGAQD